MLCVIPARSGSKRIPNKNIKNFGGISILEHAIKKCSFNPNSQIIVSSDSLEYLSIAEKMEVYAHHRSDNYSDDYVGVDKAVCNILYELKEKFPLKDDEYVLTLFPCTPQLTSELLQDFITKVNSSSCSSGMFVREYSHPIQRSLSRNDRGIMKINSSKDFEMRTQDLPKMYHDSGQAYLTKYSVLKKGLLIDSEPFGYINNKMIDIDTESDLSLAWLMYTNSIG